MMFLDSGFDETITMALNVPHETELLFLDDKIIVVVLDIYIYIYICMYIVYTIYIV